MFKFFYSKKFLIHLLLSIIIISLIVWGIFKFINSYTKHGETISVPSLEGLKVSEVENILSEKKLFSDQPDFAILFSWHIASELKIKLRKRGFKGKFIIPLPTPYII